MRKNWLNLYKETKSLGRFLVVFLENYDVPYLVVHFERRKMFGCHDLMLYEVPRKNIVSYDIVPRIVKDGYFEKKIEKLIQQGYNVKNELRYSGLELEKTRDYPEQYLKISDSPERIYLVARSLYENGNEKTISFVGVSEGKIVDMTCMFAKFFGVSVDCNGHILLENFNLIKQVETIVSKMQLACKMKYPIKVCGL